MPRPELTFAQASNIVPVGSHEYKTNIHPEYSHGPAANGGFLVGVIWRAITKHFQTTLAKYQQPETVAFHIEFLRMSNVGDATITIKDVRLGKASSTIHASLVQGGTIPVHLFRKGTISLSLDYQPDPPIPAIDVDAFMRGRDKNWVRSDVPWVEERPNHALCNFIFAMAREPFPDKNFTHQWITPRIPSAKWTTEMLGPVFDHVMPPCENYFPDTAHSVFAMSARAVQNECEGKSPDNNRLFSAPRWYPTVNMRIDVKRQLPPAGFKWLYVRMFTRDVREGRFDSTEIWDSDYNLIASAQGLSYAFDISGMDSTSVKQKSINKASKI